MVNLPFVFRVVKMKKASTELPRFQIDVSLHFTRKKKEAGRRSIIFGCNSEHECDMWMAAIEFLKTKAIYDAYAKQNLFVNLSGAQAM